MTHLQKILAHAASRAAALSLAGTLALLALLSGCATIVGDERASLPIKSTPADAQILIIDEAGRTAYRGRTPDQVPLRKSDGHYWGGKQFTVAISKRGYLTQRIQVDTHPNALYLGGNLIFGGILGWLVVDPSSGKMYDLSSEGIDVTLQKQPYEAPTAAAAPQPTITATPLPEPAVTTDINRAPAISAAPAKTPPPAAAGSQAEPAPAAPASQAAMTKTPAPAPAPTPAPASATSPATSPAPAPPSIFVPEHPPGGAGSWPSIETKPGLTPPRLDVAGEPPAPAAAPEPLPPAAPRPYWPAPPALPVSPSTAVPASSWIA